MTIPRAPADAGFAVVTGACSGIGRAMAEILAARGYPLVLVSERAAALADTAAALRRNHAARCEVIALDLADPGAAAALVERLDALGVEVELLINNAGFFFFGEAVDAEPARAAAMLQLHVTTPSLLCARLGRRMRARRRGRILIVSSVSAWRPFPGIAFYGATKCFLRSFAAALRSELRPYGVTVTCLAPGATATALYDPKVVPVELARRVGVMMPAEAVAAAGLAALMRGDAECVPGLLTRAMAAAAVRTPQPVIDWLRRRAPWLPIVPSDE